MKKDFLTCAAALLLTAVFMSNTQSLHGQSGATEVLDSASIEDQMVYIYEKTRIYNDYRAIREDIFQKLKGNVADTLNAIKLEVARLNSALKEENIQIETLNTELTETKDERDDAIRNKDSFALLGIQMHKTLYSTIMWLIILGLALFAGIMVIMFRRSHVITSHTKHELLSVQEEFDQYRKTSREKYEKLVVSHHSEIMKLKNS
jgi:hypothetical protein